MPLHLRVLSQKLAVCRLSPQDILPEWVLRGGFWSVTHTPEELSVVCEQAQVPNGIRAETGWRVLQVLGPLDFALTGILAGLSGGLAAAGISIFAISTYDTDYILVKEASLPAAVETLRQQGYEVLQD